MARLLVDRMAGRGLCRTIGVGRKWLVAVRVAWVEALPAHLHVPPGTCHGKGMLRRLAGAADARRSIVHKQAHKPWSWRAREATSRQLMAWHVGHRSPRKATRLWAKVPRAYRQHATVATDPSVVSARVMPAAQPRAISQVARPTNPRKRCNIPPRQRVSRLGRETLSCSPKLAHHGGVSTLFSCQDNLTNVPALHG
jgi:IS1 family transposase